MTTSLVPQLRRGSATLLFLLGVTLPCAAAAAAPLPGAPATPAMLEQRIQEATGSRGVVVAGHPQAAEAGLAVLKAGGNAVDAAVATSLALGVAEPYGSGMGGKLMMIIFRASDRMLFAVDGMGQAGLSINVDTYRDMKPDARGVGGPGVALPGLPSGLDLAHREFGKLEWAQVVQPAIDLAERGFRVEPQTLPFLNAQMRKLRANAELGRLYLPNRRLPEVGALLPNPELAELMRAYQRERAAGFYKGAVAEKLASGIQAAGGFLTVEDFAQYEAILTTPVLARIGSWRIASGPAPTSGGTLLLPAFAGLLTEWDRSLPLRTPQNMDVLGRIVQQLYMPVNRRIGDDPEARYALREMLAPDYIADLRARARGADVRKPYEDGRLTWNPRRPATIPAWESPYSIEVPMLAGLTAAGFGEHETSTTHFVVADAEGNVVSATQSLSHHFGGGLVVPGTGLVLNNDMSNFAYFGAGVNFVAPGKRPRSTITPTIILDGDRPLYALGVPGGQRIPIGVLQTLADLLIFGADPADSIAAPRIHIVRAESVFGEHNVWQIERDFPSAMARQLERRGWVVQVPRSREYFGGITLIQFLPDGRMRGVADLRRTNWAAAW